MARLKINFTGLEEGRLYKIKNSFVGYEFKILKGDLFFDFPACGDSGKINFDDWDIDSLLNAEYEEIKPKLTEVQRKILEGRLAENYSWVAKDKNGIIITFVKSPVKDGNYWEAGGESCVCRGVFDFLSWKDEEPTNIKELLEEELKC